MRVIGQHARRQIVPHGGEKNGWSRVHARTRCDDVRTELATRLNLHSSGIEVRGIDTLPLLSSGKVDYAAAAEIGGRP